MPPRGLRTARGVAVGVHRMESAEPCSGARDLNPEKDTTVVQRRDGRTEPLVRRFPTGLDVDEDDPLDVCVVFRSETLTSVVQAVCVAFEMRVVADVDVVVGDALETLVPLELEKTSIKDVKFHSSSQ